MDVFENEKITKTLESNWEKTNILPNNIMKNKPSIIYIYNEHLNPTEQNQKM